MKKIGIKRLIITILTLSAITTTSMAQKFAGDKIIGKYWVQQESEKSKVQFTKTGDNSYQAQICWIEKERDSKGNLRKDIKNPDKAKRETPASQIVLIEKISYKNGEWGDGEIYDPMRGKSFTVNVWFTDDETLCVKGSWGPFSQKVYWKKIKE